jgi:hypothetical protein
MEEAKHTLAWTNAEGWGLEDRFAERGRQIRDVKEIDCRLQSANVDLTDQLVAMNRRGMLNTQG